MPASINVDHATVSGVAGLSASSDISRGSVATHLRCGRICSDSFITNCLLILTVKEFWKSVNIWWSYEVYKKTVPFFGPPCILGSDHFTLFGH